MEIVKNNTSFFISHSKYSKSWFYHHFKDWEQNTFHILDYYKNNENGVCIDVGAWIGPTVLYSANIYKQIIALEPDPKAIKRLKRNLEQNDFNNITVIEKGLSSQNGYTNFGGNGDLGNSESTLLINNKNEFLSYKGRHTTYYKEEQDNIIKIKTITIDSLIEEYNINPQNISLIKIDIEGGEIIVVPAIEKFLKKYKPPLFISLHFCYLREIDIDKILSILFTIYNICYHFDSKGNKYEMNKQMILEKRIESLVFE